MKEILWQMNYHQLEKWLVVSRKLKNSLIKKYFNYKLAIKCLKKNLKM